MGAVLTALAKLLANIGDALKAASVAAAASQVSRWYECAVPILQLDPLAVEIVLVLALGEAQPSQRPR